MQVQDKKGKVSEFRVERTLSQLIGFARSIAKRNKENDIGRSAEQLMELLLSSQTMGTKPKQNWNVQRISIQHFLNEVLRDTKILLTTEAQAFFDISQAKNSLASPTDKTPRVSDIQSYSRRPVSNQGFSAYMHNSAAYEEEGDHMGGGVSSTKIDYRELQRQLGIQ